MGSHAGIVKTDSSPVSIETAEAFRDSLRRGDGSTTWRTLPSLVICHRALSSDRSRCDAQPHLTSSGLAVAVDGHLFDRESLIARLFGSTSEDFCDAAVVAAAYERWGVSCFERLLGEWSAAIYDPRHLRLTLATDYTGAVPLYYSFNDRGAWWSSELTTVSRVVPDARVSADYVAQLIWRLPELGVSPFEGVCAVPAGCAVEISDGAATIRRGWRPDFAARIRYSDERDYEAHFRDVFWRVVGDRLATPGQVWAELSGGLDSSSIVCAAGLIAQRSYPRGDKLCSVSYRFRAGNQDTDAEYRRAVVEWTRCQNIEIDGDARQHFTLRNVAGLPVPTLLEGLELDVAARMRAAGARTLLSGEGGDNVMWSHARRAPFVPLRERVRARQWSRFWKELWEFAGWSGRSAFDILWSDVVSSRRWDPARHQAEVPAWLNRTLVAESLQRAAPRRWTIDLAGAPASVRLAYYPIEAARRAVARLAERHTSVIDPSFPYLDPRLVQFMLAIPFDQKLRPRETRSLQRRALEGVLPECVRTRTSKSDGGGSVVRTFQREWPVVEALVSNNSRLWQMGVVDIDGLRHAVQGIKNGLPVPNTAAAFEAVLVEMWIRQQQAALANTQQFVAI